MASTGPQDGEVDMCQRQGRGTHRASHALTAHLLASYVVGLIVLLAKLFLQGNVGILDIGIFALSPLAVPAALVLMTVMFFLSPVETPPALLGWVAYLLLFGLPYLVMRWRWKARRNAAERAAGVG